MTTIYPATAFEQTVLRSLKFLGGQGEAKDILPKVSAWTDLEGLSSTLEWLESLNYVSSSVEQSPDGSSRTIYQLEPFGERALNSPAVNRPSRSTLMNHFVIILVFVGIESWNSNSGHIDWLYWPSRIGLALAALWAAIPFYRSSKLSGIYAELRRGKQ
ncbi:MAG TPA: hypothetical protein VKY31_16040 [Terriglobia bacterium]|nr:hypothetical protein [Terriglobia bacterium]